MDPAAPDPARPAAPPTPAAARTAGSEAVAVLKLLQQQAGHYRKLRELAVQQAGFIEQQQPERLLGVLGERQGHVEALTNLNRQLAPMRPRLGGITAAAPAEIRDGIRAATAEVKDLLTDIIRRDQIDQELLQRQKDGVVTKLRGLQPQRAAANAYAAGPAPAARGLTRHSA